MQLLRSVVENTTILLNNPSQKGSNYNETDCLDSFQLVLRPKREMQTALVALVDETW